MIVDRQSLLVRPEAALRQLEREEAERQARVERPGPGGQPGGRVKKPSPGPGPGPGPEPEEAKLRRFYGTVALDTLRMATQAGAIAEAVVQHLSSLAGAEVTVTLDIQAHLPDGAPDYVVRTVTENARTLKFGQYGF